jgi:cytochrome P450
LAALKIVSELALDGVPQVTLSLAEEYGEAVCFANPVGLGNAAGWTFLSGPKDIEHVAASNCNNYRERFLPDSYAFATDGKGILATGGSYNRKHRSLCQPSFQKRDLLSEFADMVTETAGALRQEWDVAIESRSSGGGGQEDEKGLEIDMALQMQRLTLDIIGKVAFSHNFGQVEMCGKEMRGLAPEKESRLVGAVNRFGEALSEVFITPMPVLKVLEAIRYPSVTKLRQSLETIHSEMRTIIEGRKSEYEKGTNTTQDLLDSLMQARDENENPLTTEELFEDVHDIMGAGHETTATVAAAAIFSIARHKHVGKKIREELDTVLQGRRPTFDDLGSLKYTEQTVKEVLRLYPSIPIFPRVAANDDFLPSGYFIPKGEVVFMSSYAMGRVQRHWEDPLTFNPDRFTPEEESKRHKYTFVPFGAGPRMCLGWKFAQMSLTLVLATLLQEYSFDAINPDTDILDIDFDITMNFQKFGGIKVRAKKS